MRRCTAAPCLVYLDAPLCWPHWVDCCENAPEDGPSWLKRRIRKADRTPVHARD